VQLRAAENLAALQGQTDAQGRVIDIVPWNWMSDTSIFGATFEHTYLNFYLVNGAVIVPTASNNDDAPALAELQTHFPNRDIVGVECRALGYNGGGVHCVTQQVPV
jgi:agmatine deiminase